MDCLVYLAKPTYGGWVSFTAHLSILKEMPIFKISKRTETKGGQPKWREFGYGCHYHNISIDDFLTTGMTPIVTALDKTGHSYVDRFPEGTPLVIHDPTEIRSSMEVYERNRDRFKYITIRDTVHKLLEHRKLTNVCRPHPYLTVSSHFPTVEKSGAVSISRIDYDKHTELILKANALLLDPILIYGHKNDRYVYHKLRKLDGFRTHVPGSFYRGQFDKSFKALAKILGPAKFVVDMSRIRNDGGGTQYTFLEAIDFGCALIIHRHWLEGKPSLFIPGENCYAVGDEYELSELLNSDPDTTEVVANAKKLLEPHLEAKGW